MLIRFFRDRSAAYHKITITQMIEIDSINEKRNDSYQLLLFVFEKIACFYRDSVLTTFSSARYNWTVCIP